MATGPGRCAHPLWEACAERQGSGGYSLEGQEGNSEGAAVPQASARTSGAASLAVTMLSHTDSVAFRAALCAVSGLH